MAFQILRCQLLRLRIDRGGLDDLFLLRHERLLVHHLCILLVSLLALESLDLFPLTSCLFLESLGLVLFIGHLVKLLLTLNILLSLELLQELSVSHQNAVWIGCHGKARVN